MDTPTTVLQSLRCGNWQVSLDLNDDYFQVPIPPNSRKLLRFLWRGQLWQFRALCFGLMITLYVFTSVMSSAAIRAHRRVTAGALPGRLAPSPRHGDLLSRLRDWPLHLFSDMGIMVNSHLTPSQTANYLGMDLDTPQPLYVPPISASRTPSRSSPVSGPLGAPLVPTPRTHSLCRTPEDTGRSHV